MTVFLETVSQFQSNLYDVARSVLLSRVRLWGKTTQLQEDCEQLRLENQELQRQLLAAKEREAQQRQLCESYQKENQKLREQPIRLPANLPPRNCRRIGR